MFLNRRFPNSVPVLASTLPLVIITFIFAGLAVAAGPQCTAPYVQVQDGATPLFPDPTNQFTIQRVNIGEPFVSCSAKQLTAVLKVPTMDPGNTGSPHAPPNGIWAVAIMIPGSANSTGTAQQIFIEYDTTINPAGGFNYGWFDGTFNCSQCLPGLGACAATGTVAADGTITMNLNLTSTVSFGTCGTGGSMTMGGALWNPTATPIPLTSIQGQTQILVGAAGSGEVVNDATTVGDGTYTAQGNVSCSNPPVAALASNVTSGNAPLTVNFDATASNIPAGGCGTIASYHFTFGDNTQVTQATPTVSHQYTTAGTYSARVTVTSTVGVTSSNIAEKIITVNSSGPPQLTSIVSRVTHGLVGNFDIVLPQPPAVRGVECRSTGGSYKMVFTFLNNLTGVASASFTTGAGSIASSVLGPNSNQYTVNLTGVTNIQYVTVTLNNATDSTGASGPVTGTGGFLIGDTSGNGLVNSTDVSQAQAQSGQAVTSSNFRRDINANGLINSTDVSAVQAKSGTGLVPAP